ncbi:MAG: lactonase family protein [Muribaculaceae bacterium]
MALLSSCAANDELTMLVGTYTYDTSRGIYSLSFNQQTGYATMLDSTKVENPSYLVISNDNRHVYCVTEKGPESKVNAFNFDAEQGKLTFINSLPADADPCHIRFISGNRLSVANYSGGTLAIYNIAPDGALADIQNNISFNSPIGPDTIRQKGHHIHFLIATPDSKNLLVNDLGADCIHIINLSNQPAVTSSIATKPAYGPRHSVFSPDGKTIYLLNELSGHIVAYHYDTATGLTEFQDIAADEADARGSADITISPDGRFLYASHRLKNDGISIFKISPDATLKKVGYCNTQSHPRNFIITPNGKYLLVACRDGNVIQVMSRNTKTGLLTDTHNDIILPRPVCIKFAK